MPGRQCRFDAHTFDDTVWISVQRAYIEEDGVCSYVVGDHGLYLYSETAPLCAIRLARSARRAMGAPRLRSSAATRSPCTSGLPREQQFVDSCFAGAGLS